MPVDIALTQDDPARQIGGSRQQVNRVQPPAPRAPAQVGLPTQPRRGEPEHREPVGD